MDRLAPTRRPQGRAIGYQSWRELLFLHWALDPELVAELVPRSLSIDTFKGRAWVSLIPFAMRRVRPRGIPAVLGFDFLESNVRTYVQRDGADPGVYFFSLDAASRIAVAIARLRWSLPYFHATMSLDVATDGTRRFTATRAATPQPKLDIRYRPRNPLGPSPDGSLEHFLLERYLLYVEHTGRLHRGQVHHAPYPAHSVDVDELSDEFVAATGFDLQGPPDTAHYAPGVDVEIFPLRPV